MDQGQGISEERLPRIGEPFYTTKEKGTGLGMMVSFTIIEEHEGLIRYQSKLGVGNNGPYPITGIFVKKRGNAPVNWSFSNGDISNCQSSQ